MFRLGLPWRLVDALQTEVVLLLLLLFLSRWGSDSFDVNAGRGISGLVDVAACYTSVLPGILAVQHPSLPYTSCHNKKSLGRTYLLT